MQHPEQAKFDAMSQDWWDPSGPVKTLHHLNPLRLQCISDAIPLQGATVLDIGCGGGLLAIALAEAGAVVTGVDAVASLIDVARLQAQQRGLDMNFIHGELTSITLPSFDAVVCMELLEHVDSPQEVIAQLSCLLKPGGHLIVSTINRTWQAYVQAVVAAEYVLGLLPRQTHDYQRFIRPSELGYWLRENGCEVFSVSGIGYNPLTTHAWLRPDVSVNYLLKAQRMALSGLS